MTLGTVRVYMCVYWSRGLVSQQTNEKFRCYGDTSHYSTFGEYM